MKLSKAQFYNILDSIDTDKAGFFYEDTCNEPQSHCHYQNKSARYGFFLLDGENEEEILLEDSYFLKGTHEEKKAELLKKYRKWANEWKKKQTP